LNLVTFLEARKKILFHEKTLFEMKEWIFKALKLKFIQID